MKYDLMESFMLKKSQQETKGLMELNDNTGRFGLVLSEAEAGELVLSRNDSLVRHQRVEFGAGILDKLVFAFCDSQYINQDNYLETLVALADLFYGFKNEAVEGLTDEELLTFMREQYEEICFGDLEYLAGTCLPRFAEGIRRGDKEYQINGAKGAYELYSEEQRWDAELYRTVLKDLTWK